jgi:hydroxypyruvate isomerase
MPTGARTFVANLRFAAAKLKEAGIRLLIEPINTFDIPGFYLNRTAQAIALIDEVGADNLWLQYDIYHMQRMEGELAATSQKHLPRIAHMQIADNPGRNEPGSGEINYAWLFRTSTASATPAGSAANTSPPPAPRPAWAGSRRWPATSRPPDKRPLQPTL